MPEKVVSTPYPLIDADPHFARVVRYMRPSDYAWWGALTAAFPGLLYGWQWTDPLPIKHGMKTTLRVGGVMGFLGGFLFAYQRSSFRFLGWSENKREEEKDFAELSQRAREGKPLWGESPQPMWVQAAAHRNSQFSQLKFGAFPMFNFVNHPYHGVDPAKYGVKPVEATEA
ncbi:uncharacterized protein STEHIDRAFT_157093 [Stereum hirsutum FP-91666 SS1]|uniref:uncharacterized protein n=1 Tax=Stereum hirsutum (strain FP-91666) TaxID=721885 RepID=UPI0004449256|nr:uncharacterized protein STEHIDRAFT_157093 [Stereum hirsutum FP-91666 SS1]EIM86793.1 hypothetical protein STEHIDRAFT_157093 [Stereum hirsutum FP-91666 SS1]